MLQSIRPSGLLRVEAQTRGSRGEEGHRRRKRHLRRREHPGPGGPGGGPQAAGHVHRLDGYPRPPSPHLRGHGQLGRRGAGGRVRPRLDHHPSRQLRHRVRQRARHPGRHAREGEAARRRGRAHRAARRRKVRRGGRLQGVRRPSRRGRLGGERAVGEAGPDGVARRPRVDAVLRARRAPGRAEEGREDRPARHQDHLPARPRDLRRPRLRPRRARAALPRDGLPDAGPAHRLRRRARRGLQGHLQVRRRDRRLRALPAQPGDPRPRPQEGRLPVRRGRDVERSRSRCSGTPPSRSPCSRSPTTSTPTRAARTSRASAPR